MNRNFILPIIAFMALSYSAWHVVSTHKSAPETVPPIDPPRSPFYKTLAGSGVIEPRSENIKVGTDIPGVVAEVSATVGQKVEAGDLLFRIDGRKQRAELAYQEAILKAKQAELHRTRHLPRQEDIPPSEARVAKARADLNVQLDLVRRSDELFSKRVTTEQEVVQARLMADSLRAALQQVEAEDLKLKAGAWSEEVLIAEAEVLKAETTVAQARTEVERLDVRATIRGTVLKVDVRPGEYVGTPPGQTLLVLGNLDHYHVRIDIDEQDLPYFREGLPGLAYVRGDSKAGFPMKFMRTERYAEPKKSLTGAGNERVDTRVLQVIYEINPLDRTLYVGQQVDAFIDISGGDPTNQKLRETVEVATVGIPIQP